MRPRREIDWKPAEQLWSKMGNREIAARLGVGYPAVKYKRGLLIAEATASGESAQRFLHVRDSKVTITQTKSRRRRA